MVEETLSQATSDKRRQKVDCFLISVALYMDERKVDASYDEAGIPIKGEAEAPFRLVKVIIQQRHDAKQVLQEGAFLKHLSPQWPAQLAFG
jgi:hypothetical protein